MTEDGGDGRVQVSSAQAGSPGGEGPALSGADPAFSAGLLTGMMLPSAFGYGSQNISAAVSSCTWRCVAQAPRLEQTSAIPSITSVRLGSTASVRLVLHQ